MIPGIRQTAAQLASTGTRMAATFARMAAQYPDDAQRLKILSVAASEFAARNRSVCQPGVTADARASARWISAPAPT